MKDFIAKFIRGQDGVSLVQTLVGAAIIGGLSLVAAQLSTQETGQKLVADANYGIIDVTGRIQTLVSNRTSCEASFMPRTMAQNSSSTVTSLKAAAGGADVFSVGGLYADKKVRISGMTFNRTGKNSILTVTMDKVIPGKVGVGSSVKKDFFINGEWHPTTNALQSCASDITNFIDTVAAEALSQACPDETNPTTPAYGLVKDGDKCKANFQKGLDNNALRCPAEQTIVGLSWNSATRLYLPVCRQVLGNLPTCQQNELLKRNADGSFACVSLNCPVGSVAMGMNASTGQMMCKSCPAGQFMISTPNGWECKNAMCNNTKTISQQYFVGFSSIGDPVCNPIIDSGVQCGAGANLVVSSTGAITLDCCTPSCSNAGSQCQGVAFASSNGCGTCSGTMPADCSNASNVCVGSSVTAANGCGTCPGAKPSQDGFWSPFSATTEYREKPGEICSCSTSTIPRERKFVRACTQPVCGGATCAGSTEDWQDAGTQSCTPTSCAPVQIAWELYDEYPYTADNNIKFYNRTKGTNELQAWGPYSNGSYAGGYVGDKIYIEHFLPSTTYVWSPGSYGYLKVSVDGVDVYNNSTYTQTSHGIEITLEAGKIYSVSSRTYEDAPTTQPTTTGGGGGGCFVAGTQITMHDGSLKNIEDILVGDKVLDGQKKVMTVQKLIPLDYSGEIYAINGGGYFFTPNHPFLTVDGWKSLDPQASMKETPGLVVKKMKVGDILIKKNGIELVLSLDSTPTQEKVYNFELDGSHEYIADEYVVHNKLAPIQDPVCTPCQPGDPNGYQSACCSMAN